MARSATFGPTSPPVLGKLSRRPASELVMPTLLPAILSGDYPSTPVELLE